MLLLAIALHAAPPATTLAAVHPAMPQRVSILLPVPDQRCARPHGDDIIVCGDPLPSQSLPLPAEAVSLGPVPINRDLTGTGALAAQAAPCAASNSGCASKLDMLASTTALVRGVQKLLAPGSCCETPGEATNPTLLVRDVAGGVGHLFRRKPGKIARVAILLDDTPPATSRVLP